MKLAKIKEVLVDLGLSETESRVYLSMLDLGPESVQNIAKEANISRTAAYDIIGSLQDKGLASTFQQGKKKLFSAEDPEKLEIYFKARIETMKGQLGSLTRMVPEMRIMQGDDKPRVRFYTGDEGIRALFRDVQSVDVNELLEVANGDVVYDALDEKVLLALRSAERYRQIPAKVLHRGAVRNVNPKAEYRLLEGQFIDFHGVLWVYKNRIAFVNILGAVEVVIIENNIFADTMRALFYGAWRNATVSQLP